MGASKMKLDAVGACVDMKCAAQCTAPTCNPITNEGCDAAKGESCDHTKGGFGCFPAPNDTAICETCDEVDGPYCEPGHTCLPDFGCAAYCCDDGDCGTGKCDKALLKLVDVGVCVKK